MATELTESKDLNDEFATAVIKAAKATKPKELRDEFAMSAICAFLPSNQGDYHKAASCAYKVADETMKCREEPSETIEP